MIPISGKGQLPVPGMAELHNDYNGLLSSNIRPWCLKICARLRSQDDSLQRLQLDDVRLNENEFLMLLCYLPHHIASHEISLNGMQMRDEGLARLVSALKNKPKLTAFSVAHNFLSEHSAPILGQLLGDHPELIELNLRSNSLRDYGSHALSVHVKQHPKLQLLNVEHCGIYRQGANALRAAAVNRQFDLLELELFLADNPVELDNPFA